MKFRQIVAAVTAACFLSLGLQATATAGVIGTQDYLAAEARAGHLADLNAALGRADVQAELVALGVDPADAVARAAALSDAELAEVANHLNTLPAGGDGLASEEQRVAALEDEWLDAEVRHDEATLRRVIGDRYTMNLSDGTTLGKEQYISDTLSGAMLSASITERTVLVDGDTAVTFGTVNVVEPPVDGKVSPPRSSRYTLVYVKRGGQWQALAFHISKRSSE